MPREPGYPCRSLYHAPRNDLRGAPGGGWARWLTKAAAEATCSWSRPTGTARVREKDQWPPAQPAQASGTPPRPGAAWRLLTARPLRHRSTRRGRRADRAGRRRRDWRLDRFFDVLHVASLRRGVPCVGVGVARVHQEGRRKRPVHGVRARHRGCAAQLWMPRCRGDRASFPLGGAGGSSSGWRRAPHTEAAPRLEASCGASRSPAPSAVPCHAWLRSCSGELRRRAGVAANATGDRHPAAGAKPPRCSPPGRSATSRRSTDRPLAMPSPFPGIFSAR